VPNARRKAGKQDSGQLSFAAPSKPQHHSQPRLSMVASHDPDPEDDAVLLATLTEHHGQSRAGNCWLFYFMVQ
jgi:hypothetical protein